MIRILFFVFLITVFSSCEEKNVHFLSLNEIENSIWSSYDSLNYEFSIEDTLSSYDLFFELRTTTSYSWSNIFIFTDFIFPNEKLRRDTFEFKLADPYGKWYGNKTGTTVENSCKLYAKKVNFPLKGSYTFTIHQAMRERDLDGVLDVGLKIKKIQ